MNFGRNGKKSMEQVNQEKYNMAKEEILKHAGKNGKITKKTIEKNMYFSPLEALQDRCITMVMGTSQMEREIDSLNKEAEILGSNLLDVKEEGEKIRIYQEYIKNSNIILNKIQRYLDHLMITETSITKRTVV